MQLQLNHKRNYHNFSRTPEVAQILQAWDGHKFALQTKHNSSNEGTNVPKCKLPSPNETSNWFRNQSQYLSLSIALLSVPPLPLGSCSVRSLHHQINAGAAVAFNDSIRTRTSWPSTDGRDAGLLRRGYHATIGEFFSAPPDQVPSTNSAVKSGPRGSREKEKWHNKLGLSISVIAVAVV